MVHDKKLFTDYFHQHPLGPSAIEFAIEDLFPWSEIKFPIRDCDNYFPAHDLPFHMGIGVILSRAVMVVDIA